MDLPRIGFVGVGLMGHGMARNFVDKGYPLAVLAHRNRAPVDDLVGRGAREAADAAALAEASDIVFLCVTGAPQVESVVHALAEGGRPGLIIVDCSTSEPTTTLALHKALKARGIHLCDAPLGGTPANAEAGTLSAMVGAEPDLFAKIEGPIGAFATRITHVGAPGAGHTMKLINNFLSLGYGAIYAEALTLAAKVGVSAQVFDSVIRGSRMDCGFYQTYMGYVLERDENAHRFALSNAYKDLRYLNALADATSSAVFVAASVKSVYAAAEGMGYGGWNVPQISDVVARLNGLSLGPIPQEDASV